LLPTNAVTPNTNGLPPILYYTQAGDTLPVVAIRYGVSAAQISSNSPISATSFLNPGQLLIIPQTFTGATTSAQAILPDSEVVDSPTSIDFDVDAYVQSTHGYLSTYREYLGSTGWTSGADVIKRVAIENSINPRLLLALLELRAHWITSQPSNLAEQYYPINSKLDSQYKDLYQQLSWAVDQLSVGYYSWREGRLTSLTFPDKTTERLAPGLNAGSAGLQYLFSKLEDEALWAGDLYGTNSLTSVYTGLFGSPWLRAEQVEPLFPPTLTQPVLSLPFVRGQMWSLTGGPHPAWLPDDAAGRAALDFAPGSTESGCVKSDTWVVAPTAGLVTRSDHGVVVMDLDGDGKEQTGWDLLFLHIATDGRVANGKWLEAGDLIGHPSCEGGEATGTHVHIARKYNGEWIAADGPLSFVLSGWTAHAGKDPYQGSLTKGDQTVTACTCGSFETRITRPKDDP
jgi:LysM repeat protein